MLTTAETARRLGVKPQTVYAYVSRGLLTRHRDGRTSRFEPSEVERLARRARHGGRAGALEVVVDSELTLLDPAGALYFRGRDATELARYRSFEQVAALLWDDAETRTAWEAPRDALRVCRLAQAALPAAARPAERLRVAAAAAASTDPLRDDRRPGAVRAAARGLVATLVDALAERTAARDRSIAARLWSRLADAPPSPAQLQAMNAALVLLADHELAASTLAARVAASAWADPYLVVLTGLGALGGALHGASASAAEALLASIPSPDDAAVVLGERLRVDGRLPGFGVGVYRDRDPRADALLALLRRAADRERMAVVDAVVALAGRQDGPAPTVDLALGALSTGCGLQPGAAEAIFAVGRVAGLVAHAMEEYPHRLRFRPRAVYSGPAPATRPSSRRRRRRWRRSRRKQPLRRGRRRRRPPRAPPASDPSARGPCRPLRTPDPGRSRRRRA
jgi:citrate synthase